MSDLTEDFIKNSIEFLTPSPHEHYLQVVINKPLKYDGFIMFYNSKNQVEKVPLRLEIGEPKYEPIVISSNVG